MSAPEPDEEHDGLPVSDHAPSLDWLKRSADFESVEVSVSEVDR